MASAVALRSLSLLAAAGLVGAQTKVDMSGNATDGRVGHFDLHVHAEGGCGGGDVSGVYRLKGTSELGVPFFARQAPPQEHEMNETNATMPGDMFLFYTDCNGDPAPSAWFFAPMLPPPSFSQDFCAQLASSLSLPLQDAFDLSTNMSTTWQSGACAASVWVAPLPSWSDDLIMFGFSCHAGFSGLWKVFSESRMTERPMYYMESEDGLLVLMYSEDLWECEGKNNRWSILSHRDLEDAWSRCYPFAWSDMPGDGMPMHSFWREECQEGEIWSEVTAVPRTRTPWSSGCPDSFGQYIGDEVCYTYDPDAMCPYHCHRMLLVADEVCIHTDMMWPWGYDSFDWNMTNATSSPNGSMVPILDHLHSIREECAPNEHCYSMLSELFMEESQHCFEEVCYEHEGDSETTTTEWPSTSYEQWMLTPECRSKYDETLYACEGTDASIAIDEPFNFQNVFETLLSKFWCEDDHHGGECVMIPMHLANQVRAVHC